MVVKLRLDDGQLWTIYQKSYTTLQVCHRGDEALALAERVAGTSLPNLSLTGAPCARTV